jgi:hypothetical protein
VTNAHREQMLVDRGIAPFRVPAKRNALMWFEGLLPEIRGQNLDLAASHVPYSLVSANARSVAYVPNLLNAIFAVMDSLGRVPRE